MSVHLCVACITRSSQRGGFMPTHYCPRCSEQLIGQAYYVCAPKLVPTEGAKEKAELRAETFTYRTSFLPAERPPVGETWPYFAMADSASHPSGVRESPVRSFPVLLARC